MYVLEFGDFGEILGSMAIGEGLGVTSFGVGIGDLVPEKSAYQSPFLPV